MPERVLQREKYGGPCKRGGLSGARNRAAHVNTTNIGVVFALNTARLTLRWAREKVIGRVNYTLYYLCYKRESNYYSFLLFIVAHISK